MSDQHYHEIEGSDPEHCGHQLGLMFASTVRRYVSEARAAKAWEDHKRRAALLLNSTEQYFPARARELKAYAAAANVALLDLWTMSIKDELDSDASEQCTTIVTNGGGLIGHNEDWDRDAAEDICILKKKCGSMTTLQLYYYGSPLGGTALTICSAGHIQTINSLQNEYKQIGVPKVVLARELSELGAVAMQLDDLLAIPRSSGFAHNLVDRAGRVTSIEATAADYVMCRPRTPFVHTNHPVGGAVQEQKCAAGHRSTFTRFETARKHVSPSMARSSLERLLSDTSQGRRCSIFNCSTIARGIVDLNERAAWFWLRREAELGWVRYNIEFLFT